MVLLSNFNKGGLKDCVHTSQEMCTEHRAYSREVPKGGVLPTVSGRAGLCFLHSCYPEVAMHPHLYRSNPISYLRGCYTKRDSLTDFPSHTKTECKSSFNGNDI